MVRDGPGVNACVLCGGIRTAVRIFNVGSAMRALLVLPSCSAQRCRGGRSGLGFFLCSLFGC